jgi:DNA-binding NtrC family response regulator
MMAAPRVLVVDDEVPNLTTFQRAYRKQFEISLARSGAAGLAALADQQFDVVLSDFGMPNMTGAEFVELAHGVQPVAIVMVTGYMTHPEVLELEASGSVFAIIGKPWSRESITDVVARASEYTRSLRSKEP